MKKWVWYVIASVVFVIAGGGVLYGILTHKDPELLSVCWKNGVADYNGNCQQLRWKKNQIPLTYYIDFDDVHAVYTDSVVDGTKMWHDVLCPVFHRVNRKEDANIIVKWGAYESGDQSTAAGYTSHTGSEKGPTGATIVLRNPSDTHTVFLHAAHEFGHVLGLPHDDGSRSIMNPTQPDVTEKMVLITPPDYAQKKLKYLCP